MEREIKTTSDGSKTLYIKELNESYHSQHGAIVEAQHVFIKNGLNLVYDNEIYILELGFGTGLNVLATINDFLKTDKNHIIHYYTLEKYPISMHEVDALNYDAIFPELSEVNKLLHFSDWGVPTEILPGFFFTKFQSDFNELPALDIPEIDLVYFDCFGARVQPDLWEMPLLKAVADKMAKGALLTTYSSKGSVRRNLSALGLKVEKKQGPPGKREMINAIKL